MTQNSASHLSTLTALLVIMSSEVNLSSEAQELPIFTTEEVRTTTTQNKSKKAEISNFVAIEGKLKSLELDLGLYGKKGSEDTLFDKKTEMKEQGAGDNKVDALGVTVIPFGGRDDDSPSDE